jgi:hypothetical protein
MMAVPAEYDFRLEPLSRQHDRAAFSCGVQSLDQHIETQASQDMQRKANAVFVMVGAEAPTQIVGYFTFGQSGIPSHPLGDYPSRTRNR